MTADYAKPFVVYTAVFGRIGDKLRAPGYTGSDYAHIAFTDCSEPCVINNWHCYPAAFAVADPRRRARQHKLLPHVLFPAVTHSLWVDGCLTPKGDLRYLVDTLLVANRTEIATFRHCERSCVYQELEACIRLKKDDPAVMRKQIARYRHEGYPYHNGLAETTALLRAHTFPVQQFNELWWAELSTGSVRDQLSFDYVAWRLHMPYSHLAGRRYSSPYFHWRAHR